MDRSGCLRNTGHRQPPVFIVFLALCHSFTHIVFLIRCSEVYHSELMAYIYHIELVASNTLDRRQFVIQLLCRAH